MCSFDPMVHMKQAPLCIHPLPPLPPSLASPPSLRPVSWLKPGARGGFINLYTEYSEPNTHSS